ncbi:TrbC/VirB2 family protein [Sphingomonas caeni]|uniref:TrbC/VirB2 family protein n=1 Tax=Sphingomonas caeni TaxID=2984949 RepID=UPI0029F55BFE|nr:TrbC/VirB2 family protein [Sphingomonas caeni]
MLQLPFPCAFISLSLPDPVGSSPLVVAVEWLQGTLLGTIALTLTVLAVAWVGLMMLTGRVNVRYGLTVVAGCFVLFGAPRIVGGIKATTLGSGAMELPPPILVEASPPVVIATPSTEDPYAGAAPRRRR